jgi:hypothetical protein
MMTKITLPHKALWQVDLKRPSLKKAVIQKPYRKRQEIKSGIEYLRDIFESLRLPENIAATNQ